jgi:hypothetical protein
MPCHAAYQTDRFHALSITKWQMRFQAVERWQLFGRFLLDSAMPLLPDVDINQ